jgi:nucleotide-binding universal stress UspA family protein
MTKSILCAVDLTDDSGGVVEVAAEMAANLNEHLTILFSYRLNQLIGDGDVFLSKKEVEEKAVREFKSFEKKFLKNGQLSYEFRSEIGFLSDRLESYIRKNEVDLLVIGQQLAQSNADVKKTGIENFLDKLQIPVLVVPRRLTN